MTAFVTACAFGGGKDMKKFSDLIRFPWDKDKGETHHELTDEDEQRILDIINQANAELDATT